MSSRVFDRSMDGGVATLMASPTQGVNICGQVTSSTVFNVSSLPSTEIDMVRDGGSSALVSRNSLDRTEISDLVAGRRSIGSPLYPTQKRHSLPNWIDPPDGLENYFNREGSPNVREIAFIFNMEDSMLPDKVVGDWTRSISRFESDYKDRSIYDRHVDAGLKDKFLRRKQLTLKQHLIEKFISRLPSPTDGQGCRVETMQQHARNIVRLMENMEKQTTAMHVQSTHRQQNGDRSTADNYMKMEGELVMKSESIQILVMAHEILEDAIDVLKVMPAPSFMVDIVMNEVYEARIQAIGVCRAGMRLLDEFRLISRFTMFLEKFIRHVHSDDSDFHEDNYKMVIMAMDCVGEVNLRWMTSDQSVPMKYFIERLMDQRHWVLSEMMMTLVSKSTGEIFVQNPLPIIDVVNHVFIHDAIPHLLGKMWDQSIDVPGEQPVYKVFIDYIITDLNMVRQYQDGVRGAFSTVIRKLIKFGRPSDGDKLEKIISVKRSGIIASRAANLLKDPSLLKFIRKVVSQRNEDYEEHRRNKMTASRRESVSSSVRVPKEMSPEGDLLDEYEHELIIAEAYGTEAKLELGGFIAQIPRLDGLLGDHIHGPLTTWQIANHHMIQFATPVNFLIFIDQARLLEGLIMSYMERFPNLRLRAAALDHMTCELKITPSFSTTYRDLWEKLDHERDGSATHLFITTQLGEAIRTSTANNCFHNQRNVEDLIISCQIGRVSQRDMMQEASNAALVSRLLEGGVCLAQGQHRVEIPMGIVACVDSGNRTLSGGNARVIQVHDSESESDNESSELINMLKASSEFLNRERLADSNGKLGGSGSHNDQIALDCSGSTRSDVFGTHEVEVCWESSNVHAGVREVKLFTVNVDNGDHLESLDELLNTSDAIQLCMQRIRPGMLH